LDKILAGEGTEADLKKIEDLCNYVKSASMCGLGQSAPNPVLSTLRYFRHEYEALGGTEASSGEAAGSLYVDEEVVRD
jgi:NADH:ubiquinone oxidoreductase subunit F (NADH-binding)